MPESLASITDRLESVSITRIRTFHSRVDTTVPLFESRVLAFQLAPKASLGTVTVQSAEVRHRQRRAGYECWVRIRLNLPPTLREQVAGLEHRLAGLEHRLRDLLRARYQQIDQLCCGSTSMLVAEMCLSGDNPCRIMNHQGVPIKPPTDWVAVAVVPVVALRSIPIHQAGAFVDYEITGLIVAGEHDTIPDSTAFA